MSYYINKNTLIVKEDLVSLKDVPEEWIVYPYTEYEPEKYELIALDSQDTIFGSPLDHFFNGYTSIQEIIDDLSAERNRYEKDYPQYDFFVYEELYDDEDSDFGQVLKPYGCYHPTAERVLKWYQEQKIEFNRRKENEIKNLKLAISLEETKLQEVKRRLGELEK